MKFNHTLTTTAPPATIWGIWTDVSNWSRWDTELRDSTLNGAFILGATGILTTAAGRASRFRISQFNPGQSYTMTIDLPLSSLNVYRYLHDRSDDTVFTHEVSFKGLLAPLFWFLLGRKFRAVLPSVMSNIVRIAES
ncbi:SRPBCC family protein [Chamaesiphon sp. VAR_48_metabat_403]|uniref:SRPBCC family protein n=1 Tax=Chamaesiphon sp. VAR_48_metabat_403 TaxID=2964700 RepID=UPI00286E06C3|nr:SRPBCC family protein [Chamaesiphon sp. VAR_48_metabat_403]